MEYLVHIWKEYISETELNRYSTKKMKHDREIRIFKNASAFLSHLNRVFLCHQVVVINSYLFPTKYLLHEILMQEILGSNDDVIRIVSLYM